VPAAPPHPPEILQFWRRLARRALRLADTPCYLFSTQPIREALQTLGHLDASLEIGGRPVRIRHWLSCKTQPIRPLLAWWRRQGRPIEVVSEFEFLAARAEGFAAEDILVNGPAKHRWLPGYQIPRLKVHFDSRAELETLLPLAKRLQWITGVRCLTTQEFDPAQRQHPTQFGMEPTDAVGALRRLQRARAHVRSLHFHLRTNVATPRIYERAVSELRAICDAAQFEPDFIDCGGGLPPPRVRTPDGHAYDAQFALPELARRYRRALRAFPRLRELWLENGRFLTARSGALIIRVLDAKMRRGLRQVICDGGRTQHALISTWERHALVPLARRPGPPQMTAIYGPTCMAFDQLACEPMPAGLRVGDALLWLDAGAYHIPWETRFSHGQAPVVWHDNATDQLTLARAAEPFAAWWSQWRV
jgi:diaminopimelate decarboxylase